MFKFYEVNNYFFIMLIQTSFDWIEILINNNIIVIIFIVNFIINSIFNNVYQY